jgi:alpha-galactosidase
MFTRGLVSDLIERGWDAEVALVDPNREALAAAGGLAQKMIEAKQAPVRLRLATDPREVLPNATVVICTIGVGGRRAWESDVQIPRRYGIYQPVGDTVMPGGASRSLRMIPPMVGVAEAVLELAPEALFFNYGNPMTCVCRAIHKATGANVVGLCHGVLQTAQYLARTLAVDMTRFRYNAVGINHLTWFTEAWVDDRDAMPTLRRIANERGGQATADDPFSWQLMRWFGAFPAVLDRHVVEFFPQFFRGGNYYGRKLGVDAFSFEKTIEYGDRTYAEMREIGSSPRPLPGNYFERISGEHEQVLDIIESFRIDAGRVYSVNLPNRGQVPNLPPDVIVESPAVACRDGLRPIPQKPLSNEIVGTLASRLQCAEVTVEAALTGSRERFIQALVLDGAVSDPQTVEQLADDLLAAHRQYLPQFQIPTISVAA